MNDDLADEQPFDWGEIRPENSLEALEAYIEHLLRTGQSEDDVREELIAAGLSVDDAVAAMTALRRRDAQGPELVLRSGPGDCGRVFDHLYERDLERRNNRLKRKERRLRAAREGVTEPDPAFALDEDQSNAAIARPREERSVWIGWAILLLLFLPFLGFLGTCLLSSLR